MSTQPEVVAINNIANDGSVDDGPAGARDNVRTDVENVRGGAAADTITGSGLANTLEGLGGTDSLTGAQGNDVLRGGDGDDTLRGSTDADQLLGGPDTDVADYSTSTQNEVLSIGGAAGLDGSPDDGPDGARDTIDADIETLRGGSADDSLFGDSGNNRLEGGPGIDSLTGGQGNDIELGGDGRDVFSRTPPPTGPTRSTARAALTTSPTTASAARGSW